MVPPFPSAIANLTIVVPVWLKSALNLYLSFVVLLATCKSGLLSMTSILDPTEPLIQCMRSLHSASDFFLIRLIPSFYFLLTDKLTLPLSVLQNNLLQLLSLFSPTDFKVPACPLLDCTKSAIPSHFTGHHHGQSACHCCDHIETFLFAVPPLQAPVTSFC